MSTIDNIGASAVALVLATVLAAPGYAAPQGGGVRAGVLSCNVSGGVGYLVGSQRELGCVFNPRRGPPSYYVGEVRRVGLDVGYTGAGRMQWVVVAAQRGHRGPGALSGEYVGASAEATAIYGLGANALIGGGRRSIALQPLSTTAQTGLSLAAGVSALRLTPSDPPPRPRARR